MTQQLKEQLTGCSCRGSGFNSKNPHDSSHPSITPVPRDPAVGTKHTLLCTDIHADSSNSCFLGSSQTSVYAWACLMLIYKLRQVAQAFKLDRLILGRFYTGKMGWLLGPQGLVVTLLGGRYVSVGWALFFKRYSSPNPVESQLSCFSTCCLTLGLAIGGGSPPLNHSLIIFLDNEFMPRGGKTKRLWHLTSKTSALNLTFQKEYKNKR